MEEGLLGGSNHLCIRMFSLVKFFPTGLVGQHPTPHFPDLIVVPIIVNPGRDDMWLLTSWLSLLC